MNYEKKYKEALEKARYYHSKDYMLINSAIENIFPEFKENKGEKIRKLLIRLFTNNTNEKFDDVTTEEIIAWLEKQNPNANKEYWRGYREGKQEEQKEINLAEILKHYPKETELYSPLYGKLWLAEVDEKNETITCYKHHLEEGCTRAVLEQEDTVSFYSNGTTGLPDFNISKDCMLFLYNIEKQGEPKHTDRAEPKSEIIKDKWYICTCTTCTEDSRIWFKKGSAYLGNDILKCDLGVDPNDYQDYFRIWTIHDAKDGDILAESKGDVILMFRGIGNTEWNDVIDYYCCYDRHRKKFIFQKDLKFWGCVENNQLKPATKEQRELFFQKMKEEEYTFDFKKKELKKIEQQSSQWNISDYKTWQYIVDDVLTKYWGIGQYLDDIFCKKIAKDMQKEWNKKLSLEQNPTISDSSARLENKYSNAVSIAYLQNWYQDSIDETKEPIWTDKHLEELVNDFYLIPK